MSKENNDNTTKYRFHIAQDDMFIDLTLFQFGWEKCSPMHMFGPAKRNHFLFHYIIEGKGKLETNGHTYNLHANQGFLLCPDQVSSYYADNDDPWFYTWVEFDGLRARESMLLAGLSENQPIYNPLPNPERIVENRMLKIVENAEKAPIRLVGMGLMLMDDIIQTSKTHVTAEKKRLRDFYMREAITFIESNYQKDISVDEMAKKSGLNRSYFSRLFKETFGESPQQFLIRYRINKACDLLKHTQMSIADISKAVGYDNQLHFSRAFKNTLNISPTEYRKNHFLILDQ